MVAKASASSAIASWSGVALESARIGSFMIGPRTSKHVRGEVEADHHRHQYQQEKYGEIFLEQRA